MFYTNTLLLQMFHCITKMDEKVFIDLFGPVHSYPWYSVVIMFQLVYKFITEKQFKYKIKY
jgi:hypothetical protein